MMAMLFAIFMFSVIVNEQGSFYDINEYVMEERPLGEKSWVASEESRWIVLIGNQNEKLVNVVKQWCLYTKRNLQIIEQPEEYAEIVQEERTPEMILLDAQRLVWDTKESELLSLTELGIPLVFCTLPSMQTLAMSETLQEILGIQKIMPEAVNLTGVQLYENFFLGGEVIYEAKTEQEESRQDMSLIVPWYLLGSGTKTYMVGRMKKEEVQQKLDFEIPEETVTNYFPGLLWRNSYDGIKIFAVNGEYMSTLAGIGILDSFSYEVKNYEVYPVVNAQNVLIQNYPNFSEENAEKLFEIYSRNPSMIFQGIMWPSISAMAKANNLKLTCFFNPQYQYADGAEPRGKEITFYLKQLREIQSEAGMAFSYQDTVPFEYVLEEDTKFFRALNSTYRFQTVFANEKDLKEIKNQLQKENLLQEIVTIASEYSHSDALISYFTDNITLQRMTGNAKEHSFMVDFVMRGIETALMYSNIGIDLHDAVWPQAESDEWQHLYDEVARNVSTYWKNYRNYEQTTLSESDYRVRNLLNMDYTHKRTADTITLQIENRETAAYLLLRTHDERIAEIAGGEYQKLENNAYLIKAEEDEVKITLEQVSLKEQKEK